MPLKLLLVASMISAVAIGCGGAEQKTASLDVRPLEENRSFEIIEEMIAGRSYLFEKNVGVVLANKAPFKCDYRVKNTAMAIEYITEQDRLAMGAIPPAAAGSRLHVLQGQTVPSDPAIAAESIYVLLIDERNFVYHYNPTSEQRADVTFMEVDSRLRRDLADFISWYETSMEKR